MGFSFPLISSEIHCLWIKEKNESLLRTGEAASSAMKVFWFFLLLVNFFFFALIHLLSPLPWIQTVWCLKVCFLMFSVLISCVCPGSCHVFPPLPRHPSPPPAPFSCCRKGFYWERWLFNLTFLSLLITDFRHRIEARYQISSHT